MITLYTNTEVSIFDMSSVSHSDTFDQLNVLVCGGGDSGGSGGGYVQQPTNTTTTQTSSPPAYAEPFFKEAAQRAQGLYYSSPGAFPGSSYVPYNSLQTQGLSNAIQAAQKPSQVNPLALNAVQNQLTQAPPGQDALKGMLGVLPQYSQAMTNTGAGGLTNTASGAYLNSNPYLDATFNQAADSITKQFNNSVLPGISSQFAGAGRLGSGGQFNATQQAAYGLGNQLNNLATNIYGGNYAAERQNQIGAQNSLLQGGQAAAQATTNAASALSSTNSNNFDNTAKAAIIGQSLEQEPMNRAMQLSSLGDVQRSRAQDSLAGQMSDYYKQQDAAQQNLSQYLANLAGASGSYGAITGNQQGMQYAPMQATSGSSVMGGIGTGLSLLGMATGGYK